MANIKDDPAYDPFPKTGLVKQYERYIRGVVEDFAKNYPEVGRPSFLFRAVELAHAAEKTFKPELGFKFSTHLGGFARPGRLKELHRLHDILEKERGVEIYRTEEDLAYEKTEEDGEPTDPVNFAGGGNGVRLLFDLQWWEAMLSNVVSVVTGATRVAKQYPSLGSFGPAPPPRMLIEGNFPTTKARHRLKLGTQLRQSDNAIDAHKRISADLPQVVKQQPLDPELMGWIRAVVDHDIRRQREADDEVQKRAAGDHSPTFLEANRNAVDVKFYKGRRPPRFLPKFMIMARLDDMYSHHPDAEDGHSLHDSVAAPDTSSTYEKELQAAMEAVKALRPTLANKNEIAVLDALEARLEGRASGGFDQMAKELGMLKGTASKVAHRLAKLIRGRKAK